ncbi:MAG: prepilin-type N-terminal cleavage/methylation domain-containing protein [Phycisphaerae bacterium]|nr:prepilin-type N-terminal cleavage/methylation domain-containing protein [Phycisphaerae bacterium]MDP7287064.1 prepilin-type N-terminal cleavage/methylation domain-containing protein [Phycisphaerae bacterium]
MRPGFTMIEMLIAISLVSLILVIGVVSGTASSERRKFQYAVDRLETTLRMARADSANKARRIRLSFDEETRLPKISWEPQPLAEPGIFEPYADCPWRSRVPKDFIEITNCRLIGPDGKPVDAAPSSLSDDSDSEEMQTITFGPDGTSDSVLIEMESTGLENKLRAAIKLDGENNIIKSKIIYDPSENEDDEEDPFAEDEDENSE